MSEPTMTCTDVDVLRELIRARTEYEERYGWPVTVEVERARLVLRVGELADAVVIPRPLAVHVLADLRIALLAGPVLADTTGQWWMFLTRPADRSTPKLRTELRYLDVHLVPRGAQVVVPREFDGKNRCPWIEQPRRLSQLPPWPAVIGTARRVGEIPPQRMREPASVR